MGGLTLIVVAVVLWFILATMVLPAATIDLIEPDVASTASYGYVLHLSICGSFVTHKRYYQVMVRHGPP